MVGAAFFGFFFASLVHRGELVLNTLDPIWMGLFAVIGAQQSINAGLSSFAAILVGCISAFGGAVLRDLLAGETPQLVLPGPINYLAAILGAIIYVGMVNWAGIDRVVAEWVTVAIVFGLRMLALRYGIKAPEPVDVPRHVRRRVLSNWRARRRGVRLYRGRRRRIRGSRHAGSLLPQSRPAHRRCGPPVRRSRPHLGRHAGLTRRLTVRPTTPGFTASPHSGGILSCRAVRRRRLRPPQV